MTAEGNPCNPGQGVTGVGKKHGTTTAATKYASGSTPALATDDLLSISLAVTPGRNAAKWQQGTTTWDEVRVWLENPADHKETRGYVLGTLAGERRNKSSIVSRSALTLDVDSPRWDFLDRLKGELGGHAAIIHSTFSSTAEAPRYRVIVPLASAVSPGEYRAAVGELMSRVSPDGGEFDAGSGQPERFMYLPSVQPGQDFWYEVWEGDRLDAAPLVDAARAANVEQDAAPAPGSLAGPGDAKAYFRSAVSEEADKLAFHFDGSRNAALNRAAFKLGQLAHLWPADDVDGPDDVAQEALLWACDANGLLDETDGEQEFEHTFGSGWSAGVNEPRNVQPAELEGERRDDKRERAIQAELERLEVREEARRRFNAQNRIAPEMPEALSLTDLLAANLDAPRWRIEGMWPAGGRVNMVAAAKAGKTTTTGNLVRSLADGEDFLGCATTALTAGDSVTIFDTEMTEIQLQDWYDSLDLRHHDKVRIVPIAGKASGLNFMDDDALRSLVPKYGGSHTYILDPVGPVLSGLGLDENSNSDVQRFLSAWDTFVTLMGGKESLITHHAGHSAERARGASAFLGSGSAIWTLINEDPDDPASQRYIKALGRDVSIPETRLVFDPFTRRLSLGGGSRAQHKRTSKINTLVDAVHLAVAAAPGMNTGELEQRLRDESVSFRKGEVHKAAAQAVERGMVRVVQKGPARLYFQHDGEELL